MFANKTVQVITTVHIHAKHASYSLDERLNKYEKQTSTNAKLKIAELTLRIDRIVRHVDTKNASPLVCPCLEVNLEDTQKSCARMYRKIYPNLCARC